MCRQPLQWPAFKSAFCLWFWKPLLIPGASVDRPWAVSLFRKKICTVNGHLQTAYVGTWRERFIIVDILAAFDFSLSPGIKFFEDTDCLSKIKMKLVRQGTWFGIVSLSCFSTLSLYAPSLEPLTPRWVGCCYATVFAGIRSAVRKQPSAAPQVPQR